MTKIPVAEFDPYGSPVALAVVPPEYTQPSQGAALIRKIQPHLPTRPIMLVSVMDNGFRAYAPFQTHLLLIHAQLQYLDFFEVDLTAEPPSPPPPF